MRIIKLRGGKGKEERVGGEGEVEGARGQGDEELGRKSR